MRLISLAPLLPFFCLLTWPALGAEPELPLDEVLEGFADGPVGDALPEVLEDVLQGFDETAADADARFVDQPAQPASGWNIGGEIEFSTAYNFAHHAPTSGETDYRGLSRARTSLDLELTGDVTPGWRLQLELNADYDAVYQINGRDDYNSRLLNDSESEVEIGEAYLQGSPASAFDLKLGRQILVWGKSDNLRVTDILNPLDLREPGIVDIEDLRLPVTMSKLDCFIDDWGLSLVMLPEVRFSKTPPYGSDFYQGPVPPSSDREPADGFGNMQYALAANGIFTGWDLSLYWADIYRDQGHLVTAGGTTELRHERINMTGAATNVVLGNWLLKGEFAYLSGLRFSGVPGLKRDRSDLLVGIEYSGFDDTMISLERVLRRISGFNDALEAAGYDEQEWQTALRYQGEFLHARLKLTGVATYYGESLERGGFLRISGDYELAEAQILTIGVIFYENGERPPAFDVGDNDRVFASYSYSF